MDPNPKDIAAIITNFPASSFVSLRWSVRSIVRNGITKLPMLFTIRAKNTAYTLDGIP
jgi:hypothetical protein